MNRSTTRLVSGGRPSSADGRGVISPSTLARTAWPGCERRLEVRGLERRVVGFHRYRQASAVGAEGDAGGVGHVGEHARQRETRLDWGRLRLSQQPVIVTGRHGLAVDVELSQRGAPLHRKQEKGRFAAATEHDAAGVAFTRPAADVVEAVGLGLADVGGAQLVEARRKEIQVPCYGAAGAGQFTLVGGGQRADVGRPGRWPSAAACRHQQHLQRCVTPVEHRIGLVRGEQQAALVRDGSADDVAPARPHGCVVVGDLEAERRLSGRLCLGAPQHRGRRVRARDLLQHRLEHRIGWKSDALAVRGGPRERAGPGRDADDRPDCRQCRGAQPQPECAVHRLLLRTTRASTIIGVALAGRPRMRPPGPRQHPPFLRRSARSYR